MIFQLPSINTMPSNIHDSKSHKPPPSNADVSLAVGDANPSHFAYLFKREYGISPSKLFQSNSL